MEGWGESPLRAGFEPVPEHTTQAPSSKSGTSSPGPGRCRRCPVRTDRGLGSGRQNGPGGEGVALRMQEALLSHIPRAQKGQIPGPREEAGEQSPGGVKEGGRTTSGPRPGGGRWCWGVRVSSLVGEGGVPGGLAAGNMARRGHRAGSGAAQPAPALPLVGRTLRANPFSPAESPLSPVLLGDNATCFIYGAQHRH